MLLHIISSLNSINIGDDLVLGEVIKNLLRNFLEMLCQLEGHCKSPLGMLSQTEVVPHSMDRLLVELRLVLETSGLLDLSLFLLLF